MNNNYLILSFFPGIDLLGRGFPVVKRPDLITGEDIRGFNVTIKG